MEIREYRAGDVLFHEDETSSFACRLLEGDVEIGKRNDGAIVLVGTVGAGEFVGEMGVIEGTPRSATVRAVSNVKAEIFPAAQFLDRISSEPELALRLLSRLSERVKKLNLAFAEAMSAGPAPSDEKDHPPALPSLRLLPGSEATSAVVPAEGIVLKAAKFWIGREAAGNDPTPPVRPDLTLRDRRPYRLSRLHFAVERAADGYIVRDLDSTLGTQVNGRGLGRMFTTDEARLDPGETEVIAGGRDSPFRFRLVC